MVATTITGWRDSLVSFQALKAQIQTENHWETRKYEHSIYTWASSKTPEVGHSHLRDCMGFWSIKHIEYHWPKRIWASLMTDEFIDFMVATGWFKVGLSRKCILKTNHVVFPLLTTLKLYVKRKVRLIQTWARGKLAVQSPLLCPLLSVASGDFENALTVTLVPVRA